MGLRDDRLLRDCREMERGKLGDKRCLKIGLCVTDSTDKRQME